MANNWWNSNYTFRRQIVVNATKPILAGHPIYVTTNYPIWWASNKLREDFEDLVVVKHHLDAATPVEFATPADYVVPHKNIVDEEAGTMQVVFNAEDDIYTFDDDYYLYFNNPSLTNAPIEGPYIDSDYIIITTPDEYNSNLTFSRPNEDWIDGSSTKVNARAALNFFGPHARIRLVTGPDKGIVELRVDDQEPVFIDAYNQTEEVKIVYTTSGLSVDKHYLRLRVTGEKAPSSENYTIKIYSLEYSNYTKALLLWEEIYSQAGAFYTIVGP